MIDKLSPLYARGVKPIPVIPTVYTDALSYGEQLGIVGKKCDECVDKVNEVVEDNQTFKSDITEQQSDFEETMQGQYDEFLEDYQRQFGVTQIKGNNTELVMSQKAVTDEFEKVVYKPNNSYGLAGQVLESTGDGIIWSNIGTPTDTQVDRAVSDWLDEHPEATTTVQNNSLTIDKFTGTLVKQTYNYYKTPEMYGAEGDGVTDDTDALEACLTSGTLVILKGTYKITRTIHINNVDSLTVIGGKIIRPYNEIFSSFTGMYCNNVTFIGTLFDGNGNVARNDYVWKDNYQCCFVNEHSKNISFINCVVTNYYYGLYIIGSTEHVDYECTNGLILNCCFTNCETGIDTYGKALTIDGCYFEECGNAIQLEPNYTYSDIEDITQGENYYTCGLNMIVNGCTFVGDTKADIRVFKNNYYPKFTNNCHINFKRAVIIQDSIVGAIISGNTFRNCVWTKPDNTVRPWTRTYACISIASDNVKVENNKFDYCAISIMTEATITAEIYNNTFEHQKWCCIVAYQGTFIVKNNTILGYVFDDTLWTNSRPIVLSRNAVAVIQYNYIDSNIEPINSSDGSSAYIDANISTIAQTANIPLTTGYNVISNLS